MSDSDYITTYRRFFEQYGNTIDSNDPLPLRVASYTLKEEELLGQIVDCCMQYLYLINCPLSLQPYLSKLAIDEVCNFYREKPFSCYEPLKIMQTATKTVGRICHRHLDNETLSKVPPPGNEPPVSALGIKHTRRKMEDRMVFIPRLNSIYNIPASHEAAYYAIFDGHGGPDAATYAVSHYHQFMVESSHYPQDVEKAMRESYAKTDNFFLSKKISGGSTAVVVLHEPEIKKMTVSWLGDSQAMLIRAGRPVMLTNPHRPDRPDEVERIHKGGGFVTQVSGIYRVNGDLGVSRSFGDSHYKPLVSAEPEVVTVPMDGTEEALILGCDGFWDVLDERKVCETVYFHVVQKPDCVDLLSKRLVDLAKEFHSTDNISVIAVLLKPATELTPPSLTATMETPELEPFRANGGSLLAGSKHDDDDFGPETDVDAPDDGNPFGWTRPDPLQPYADLSALKNNPGVRFNNEYVGLDNPFSNNLHDIAEEKSTEDLKAEKEIFNNNEFVANNYGNDLFDLGAFQQTNGNETKLSDDGLILEKSEVVQGLPDVVNITDTADVKAESFDSKFERDIFEQEELPKNKELCCGDNNDNESFNPFDCAAPELASKPNVVESSSLPLDIGEKNQVELETLKSLVLAESVNEDEQPVDAAFTINEPIDSAPRDNEFDGQFAVEEDVVETGPEGDESEEEWNYYQGDEKRPDSSQVNERDLDNMNSPLNPNAAEFVPVSPPCGLVENKTPLKAIPPGLLDDIASSPNWANMDAVVVPDVDTFLEGAKTRPSDVTLDPSVEPFVMQTGQDLDLDGVKPLDDSITDIVQEEVKREPSPVPLQDPVPINEPEVQKEETNLFDLETQPRDEPRGLDLATDMTSSFIDPSTMGRDDSPQNEEVKVNGFGHGHGDVEDQIVQDAEKASFHDDITSILERQPPQEQYLNDAIEPPQLAAQIDNEIPAVPEIEHPLLLNIETIEPIQQINEATKESVDESTPLSTIVEPSSSPVNTSPLIADLIEPEQVVADVPETKVVPDVIAAAAAVSAATAAAAAVATATAVKKWPTKSSTPSKPTPRTTSSTPKSATTTPKIAPTKKPATTTTTTRASTTTTKPAVTAAAKTAPAKLKTTVSAAAPAKPKTTVAAKPNPTTVARAPAAAKPAPVKSTIPPRTTTTTAARPRVPSAPTNGIANGDVKTRKPAVEPVVKKTAPVTARVPLSSRPATAPATARTTARSTTTTAKPAAPATTRPSSARPSATTAATKAAPRPAPATTGVKKSVPAAKTNGVSKTTPAAVKRAVPAAKAETKTEAKTADKAPQVVSNGISAAE